MANSSLKKNYIYNLLYQVLLIIVPLITSPYLTRTLGAESLGIYSYVFTLAQYFVIVGAMGLKNYGNREIARIRDDKEKLSIVFSEIYVMQLFTAGLVCCIYLFSILFIIKEDKNIYWIFSLYVISSLFDINWCFFGLEKFGITVTRNTIIKIISTILIFIFVKKPDDLWIYTLIMTLSLLVSQMVLWPIVFRELTFIKPNWQNVLRRMKPNILLFIPVLAVSLYNMMDKLMLGIMCSKKDVGFYSYSESIMGIPKSFITALGTIMMPRTANLLHMGKKEESSLLLQKSMQYSMFLSGGCTFGLMALAKLIIPWYYGDDFSVCANYVILLAPCVLFISWNSVIRSQYVIPRGMDKIYIWTVSSGAVVNLFLNLLLIRRFGGYGAVVATVIAELTVCLVQWRLLRKEIQYSVLIPDTIVFCIIGGIMGSVIWMLPNLFSNVPMEFIFKVLVGTSIYCALSFIYLCFVKKDYTMIKIIMGIFRRRGKK